MSEIYKPGLYRNIYGSYFIYLDVDKDLKNIKHQVHIVILTDCGNSKASRQGLIESDIDEEADAFHPKDATWICDIQQLLIDHG